MTKAANALNNWLRKHDVTLRAFANQCEMHENQLCHVRKGRRCPTLEQAVKIWRETGIPVQDWMDESLKDLPVIIA